MKILNLKKIFLLLLIFAFHNQINAQSALVNAKELTRISKVFSSRPKKMIYVEKIEYLRATQAVVKKELVLKNIIMEEDGQVSHKKFIKGKQKIGKVASGGIPLYKFAYPFMPKELSKYVFYYTSPSEICFFPRNKDKKTYAGRLFLENNYPRKLELVSVYRFPNLEYYLKEVTFHYSKGVLLEDFIQVHGSFELLPFVLRRSRYTVHRYNYVTKNVSWQIIQAAYIHK